MFGVHSGKTLEEVKFTSEAGLHSFTYGGLNNKVDYIKYGFGDHFLWFEDMEDARKFGEKLVQLSTDAQKINKS